MPDMPDMPDMSDMPDISLSDELVTTLAEGGGVRIERIVSTGQVSGWYDQVETEFVVLLDGFASIEYGDGRTVSLSRGDTLLIKPHERHKVCYTSIDPPCIWLCVFYNT